IWTTTPWTLPGNRAIAYSPRIKYGLYEVTDAPNENWAKVGDKLIVSDALVDEVRKQARVTTFERKLDVSGDMLVGMICAHPLRDLGYNFFIPLLEGNYVTDDIGTGFVHTAPGHGREDFDVWMENKDDQAKRPINIWMENA